MAVSAIQAVTNVWHQDIVPQYGPGRMEEAKALRRSSMHAEPMFNQPKRPVKIRRRLRFPSHKLQASLFAH